MKKVMRKTIKAKGEKIYRKKGRYGREQFRKRVIKNIWSDKF